MVEHREELTYMVEAVAELPERLRVVVQEYFLAERPMAEIAEQLGVSESRVSQMRAEALVLLKDAINAAAGARDGLGTRSPRRLRRAPPRGVLRGRRRPPRRRCPPGAAERPRLPSDCLTFPASG